MCIGYFTGFKEELNSTPELKKANQNNFYFKGWVTLHIERIPQRNERR